MNGLREDVTGPRVSDMRQGHAMTEPVDPSGALGGSALKRGQSAQAQRDLRSKAALKTNMARRKAQVRARDEHGPGEGAPDAGETDAGPKDAGLTDAGPQNAGPIDAGQQDAGPKNVGPKNAGQETE